MPSQYDSSDFVDTDFESARRTALAGSAQGVSGAPSREEIDARVSEAQLKLAELKRAQEELERERAALEETRRRQLEFQNGREEMLQSLTRGLGLLEEAEFAARRDAEQMAKCLSDLQEALRKIQGIREETWSKEQYSTELTRALTTIENARMEWNSARLKFPVLAGAPHSEDAPESGAASPILQGRSFGELCRLGFALTWPVAVVGLGILLVLVLRS